MVLDEQTIGVARLITIKDGPYTNDSNSKEMKTQAADIPDKQANAQRKAQSRTLIHKDSTQSNDNCGGNSKPCGRAQQGYSEVQFSDTAIDRN